MPAGAVPEGDDVLVAAIARAARSSSPAAPASFRRATTWWWSPMPLRRSGDSGVNTKAVAHGHGLFSQRGGVSPYDTDGDASPHRTEAAGRQRPTMWAAASGTAGPGERDRISRFTASPPRAGKPKVRIKWVAVGRWGPALALTDWRLRTDIAAPGGRLPWASHRDFTVEVDPAGAGESRPPPDSHLVNAPDGVTCSPVRCHPSAVGRTSSPGSCAMCG